MSHGWFVLLMAVAVVVVVAFFAWAVRFMVREFGGWQTLRICSASIVVAGATLLIILVAAGVLQ